MIAQGATPGTFDPSVMNIDGMRVHDSLLPTFKKTEVIGGVERVFEGTSQEDLTHQIVVAYREFAEEATRSAQSTNKGRDGQGRFTSQSVAVTDVEKVELELAFKRGDIPAAEYLSRSGALDDYLRDRGIDVDAAAQNHQLKAAQNATEQFLQSHPEWPGGQENLRRMSTVLQENMEVLGLDRGELTPQILERAYEHMRENNLLVANEEVVAEHEKKMREATTPEELRAAANAALGRTSSGWFGGR